MTIVALTAFGLMSVVCEEPQPVIEKPALQMDARISLNLLISLCESHMVVCERELSLLSLTDEAQSSEWAKVKPLLSAIQKHSESGVFWFANPDGSHFTVDKDLTDQNLSDRAYFPVVLTGKPVIGALVVSHSTGRNSGIVCVPVFNKAKDKVVSVLGASIFLDDLSATVCKQMQITEDVLFFALADDGKTVLNSKPSRVFQNPAEQGSKELADAVNTMMASNSGSVDYTYDGGLRSIVFAKSPLTGWRFAIGRIVK